MSFGWLAAIATAAALAIVGVTVRYISGQLAEAPDLPPNEEK